MNRSIAFYIFNHRAYTKAQQIDDAKTYLTLRLGTKQCAAYSAPLLPFVFFSKVGFVEWHVDVILLKWSQCLVADTDMWL